MNTAVEERLKIGEVAARVGVTTRTIRYYEERGLLGSAPDRQKGGHRTYTEADVTRLTELVHLRDLLGLSLEELAGLAEAAEARAELRDRWEGSGSDAERLRIVQEAAVHVRRQIALVQGRQERLTEFAAELTAKLDRLDKREKELKRP